MRLAKGRGSAAEARRRGGGGGNGAAAVQGGGGAPGSAGAAANGARAADSAGRGAGGGGGPGGAAASVAESLVLLLRAEPGGSMPAAHASRRLCALVPGAEREIAAAGGFRRFCSMFPGLVGVDADGGGRGTVFLRGSGAVAAAGPGASGIGAQYWGETSPLLPLPPPSVALGAGRGPLQSWPAAAAEAFDPHAAGWSEGPALWARPHGGGWSPGGGGEGLMPMGGVHGLGRGAGGTCGGCGDGLADSRLAPCGHSVCRQCAHVMVMMMMVANQR